PASSLDTALTALGEPETVANRYLMERGLKPIKPPISPMVKWIVIGILGTAAMFFGFVTIVSLYALKRVDFSSDGDRIHVGTKHFSGSSNVEGKWQPTAKQNEFTLKFAAGKMELGNSSDEALHWRCKSLPSATAPQPETKRTGAILDLSGLPGSC